MTSRKKKWLISIAVVAVVTLLALFLVGRREMAHGFEPYVRELAINYVKERFDSEAEIGALRISMPNLSPLKVVLKKGRGAMAHVEAEDVVLRHRGRHDIAQFRGTLA